MICPRGGETPYPTRAAAASVAVTLGGIMLATPMSSALPVWMRWVCLALVGAPSMSTAPASRAGNDLLWNGSFTEDTLRPWSVGFDSARRGRVVPARGELCLAIDREDARENAHRFDVIVRQGPLALSAGHRYQLRFRTHATAATRVRPRLSRIGTPATEYWSAVVASDGAAVTYTGTYDAVSDEENAELVFELGGDLLGAAPLTVCLSDVELNDPRFEPPVERGAPRPPRVSVNQLGYLPGYSKLATVRGRRHGGATGLAARRSRWAPGRRRQDAADRRRHRLGRARPPGRFLVGHCHRHRLQAARGRGGDRAAARGCACAGARARARARARAS